MTFSFDLMNWFYGNIRLYRIGANLGYQTELVPYGSNNSPERRTGKPHIAYYRKEMYGSSIDITTACFRELY